MPHECFSTEELAGFKEMFCQLISEVREKNGGVLNDDEEGILLLGTVSKLLESVSKENPMIYSPQELKIIKGMLIITLFECMEEMDAQV